MRFLRRGSGSGESPEEISLRLDRAEHSRQLVERGGIPLEAEERIRRQMEEGGVWTSDLSVDELAALRGIGYEPIAQVLGSSLYRLGWINTGWNQGAGLGMGMRGTYAWGAMQPEENASLTRSLLEARARAIHRLVLEAQGLKADGVVGVRLNVSHWDWAQGMSEFTVLGTAVRRIGAPPSAEPGALGHGGQRPTGGLHLRQGLGRLRDLDQQRGGPLQPGYAPGPDLCPPADRARGGGGRGQRGGGGYFQF